MVVNVEGLVFVNGFVIVFVFVIFFEDLNNLVVMFWIKMLFFFFF